MQVFLSRNRYLRNAIAIIAVSIITFLPLANAGAIYRQQPAGATRPKKVLTPEQEAFQEQLRQNDAVREAFRAKAKAAFDVEMAKEKAGDCPNAQTTYDFNICFSKAVTATDENLTIYEDAVRGILSLKDPVMSSQPNSPGPAGAVLTSEQIAAEFDRIEQAWQSYRDAAAKAAFDQFEGGTGAPGNGMQMRLRLTRNHMKELDAIYDGPLHR